MARRDLFSLEGKVALVTGGGRGIGRFISEGLAGAGSDLIITSRQRDILEQAAAEMQGEFGVRVEPLACDLGNPAEIAKMFQAATSAFPRIDVLVNNAGIAEWGATLDYAQEAWDRTFDVNVRGVFLLTRHWANWIKEQGGGVVINVSSIMGFRGSGEEHPLIAYNPSKAAVISLTQTLAVKLAPHGIRVNGIAPGYFSTDMMAFLDDPNLAAIKQGVVDRIPAKRPGEVDDMRGVAVFLASDASAFVNGHTLVVDGGQTAY